MCLNLHFTFDTQSLPLTSPTVPMGRSILSLDTEATIVDEVDGSNRDDLWDQAFHKALQRIPTKDSEWLANKQHQKPFTSTEIVEAIRPFQEKYSEHPAQKFLARIDPIVSHIRSFTGAINTFTNSDPTGFGYVWGSIHLVLIVRNPTPSVTADKAIAADFDSTAGGRQDAANAGEGTRFSLGPESATGTLLQMETALSTSVLYRGWRCNQRCLFRDHCLLCDCGSASSPKSPEYETHLPTLPSFD